MQYALYKLFDKLNSLKGSLMGYNLNNACKSLDQWTAFKMHHKEGLIVYINMWYVNSFYSGT